MELNITEEEYYNALSISSDSDFQIHIKREPNACFINNFFIEKLQAWKANIDIQPVVNHYKGIYHKKRMLCPRSSLSSIVKCQNFGCVKYFHDLSF